PLMIIMAFVIIDFGGLIEARLIVANLAREGGSLASRDVLPASNLITMLQDGASPLNLVNNGRIYVWSINAGTSAQSPNPYIDPTASASAGNLNVASTIGTGQANLGLTQQLYNHLEFDNSPGKKTSDINNVTVVEVFYKYTPITPISKFVPQLFTSSGGEIISSKAVF
ncbi:MAG TPA: TadE family protein, partial [Syntrophorhabdales bacterium]|nr:TadE family protein [Syntrophorhabdales bacterium]